MTRLGSAVRSAFHAFGLDLTRYSAVKTPQMRLLRSLEKFEIDLVLDVGANEGQFASELLETGYRGRVVSFEPLSAAHHLLVSRATGFRNWQVHPRCAIGDHDGDTQIHIAGNSVSSSILEMTPAHSEAEKKSTYRGAEATPLWRADTAMTAYATSAKNIFLKIDTQGYEWRVLDGAAGLLPQVKGISCEMSLVPLYEGQHLWRDILTRLEHLGFTLWAIEPGFTDPRDGRSLQFDATFYRV